MAELPEAIVVSRQMREKLCGKVITAADANNNDKLRELYFVNRSDEELSAELQNEKIVGVRTKGKWIIVDFEGAGHLLLALEMGGKMLYSDSPSEENKYNLKLQFDDSNSLVVRITMYGFMRICNDGDMDALIYPGNIGPSVLGDDRFTAEYFADIIAAHPNVAIKSLLIDQKLIAGLANSYANDILWTAKIFPKRKTKDLYDYEIAELYKAIVTVMTNAVNTGGRKKEFDLFGNEGRYVLSVSAESVGSPCPRCGNMIEKIGGSGGGTFVCRQCQPT